MHANGYAQRVIREEAARTGHLDINAAGVEGSMRLMYGTLDHLTRDDFHREIAIAAECEAAQPSYLAECAKY